MDPVAVSVSGNGENPDTATVPVIGVAMLYDELSTNLGLWHVNSMVLPPKLINGAVGGVKFAVYNATPMLNLKLLIYPGKYAGADVSHRLPT